MELAKTNRRLLMIEDDVDQRELVREVLEDHFGAGCVTCAEGRAEALAQDLASFDLILTDYNLPDCTGMELLAEIRSRCETPVIMVTGENVTSIAAEAVRNGAIDYIVKVGEYIFTIPLVIEKNLMTAKLTRENDRLRKELEGSLRKTEELAATDPLTGLYNRRHFSRVLDQQFAETQRSGGDLSCLMIDLDKYKQLNDTFGHATGDELLVVAARSIDSNLRRMDVAARYGGDEFILLLPTADSDEAQRVAGRIRDQFRPASAEVLNRAGGASGKRAAAVTMSIGIGSVQLNRPATPDDLMAAADEGLYAAKEAGRDRISIARPRADIPRINAA